MAKIEVTPVTVARSYAHKVHGQIGAVELVVPVSGDVTVNGQVLPASSVEHLFNFALQTLQDAYAGADSADDAVAAFTGKLERLIAGTLGTRTGGGGVDPVVAMMRVVMRPLVKAEWVKTNDKAGWKALGEDEIVAMIDDAYAGLDDADKATIDAAVGRRLELAAAEREAKAGLGGVKLAK